MVGQEGAGNAREVRMSYRGRDRSDMDMGEYCEYHPGIDAVNESMRGIRDEK
jgi:hypothetical protein